MNWFAENWQILATLLGTGGAGAWGGRVYSRYLQHKEIARKQSDTVALDMVGQWKEGYANVENELRAVRAEQKAERESCDRQLSELRHSLNNELSSFDSVCLIIEMSPHLAADAVKRVRELRDDRRDRALEERRLRLAEQRHQERALIREGDQLRVSEARHERDATGAAAVGA